jgi:hypothetical protein
MRCPYCNKEIADELIRSEGARLMNASRTDVRRDPEMMRRIGRMGGSMSKTKRSRSRKTIEFQRAEIRRLSEELAQQQNATKRKS